MILLASLAALSLGAAPVQAQSPAQSAASVEPVKVQITTPAAPAAPATSPAPVTDGKAKPKPWLGPDMVKLAGKLSVLAKL